MRNNRLSGAVPLIVESKRNVVSSEYRPQVFAYDPEKSS